MGAVAPVTGNVRLRMAGSAEWRDVAESEDVRPGDSILTGDTGKARLRIDRLPEAELAPSTLIVVEEPKDRQSRGRGGLIRSFFNAGPSDTIVDVERGGMRLELPSGQAPIRVRLRGRVFELQAQNSGAMTEVTQDSIAAVGQQGIQIHEVGKTTESTTDLRAGQSAVLDTKQSKWRLQDLDFEAKLPEAGAVVFTDVGQKVEFTWSRRTRVKGSGELMIRSGAESKSELRIPLEPEQVSAQVDLPAGVHSWRIQWQGGQTPWRSLTHVERVAPVVRGPVDGALFEAPPTGEAEIPLLWNPLHADLRPEVERRAKGEASVTSFGERGGIGIKARIGNYEWRVRALDPQGVASAWSEWHEFQVGTAEDRAAWVNPLLVGAAEQVVRVKKPDIEILPTLESSRSGGSTRLKSEADLDRIELILAWKPLPGVKQYKIRVFRAGEPYLEKTTSAPQLMITLSSLKETKYDFEVAATLPSGKAVHSDRVQIKIELSPPVPLLPEPNASAALGDDLLMTWEKTSLTQYYDLQISANPRFTGKKEVERSVVQNFYGFKAPRAGTYYWRLKAHTEGKESGWSEPRRFSVK